jgi:Carboxypeptidase regulatory-like domain
MVVNSVTGLPIARVLVELDVPSSRYTMTDANGAFRFEGVAEGSVKLEAERPGFFKPGEVSTKERVSSSFQVTGDVDSVVLKLVPQADIAGHVRSIDGLPIPDFPIRLYERRIVDGAAHWENVASVTCDQDGYFRVFGLAEGSFVISAGPEPWRPRPPAAKHIGYPLVFYPNVHDFAAASVLSVTAGEHVEADFSLSQELLFEISGGIVGVPGAVDAKVELYSNAGDPVPLVQPHPERHEFLGYVNRGRYTLRTSAEVDGQVRRTTVPLTIDSNTAGIKVALGPQLSIPVNLRTEPANSDHRRRTNVSNASVILKSTSAPLSPVEFSATQIANRDQTVMEIVGAEPNSYSVEIDPYNAYVRAATSGSTDLLQNDLLVPEDGMVAPIEIVLSSDGGEVGGNVKSPDHDSSATVLLLPDRGPSKEIKSTATQANGEFQFEHVRPGEYVLLAFDRAEDLEYRNPDVLTSYLSSATHVSVPPRQLVRATLELIQRGK